MKKLKIIWLMLVVVCLALTSCENEKDVQSNINRLRSVRNLIERDVDISGSVTGSIQTMSGDVDCGTVGGSITTRSGDIKHRKHD